MAEAKKVGMISLGCPKNTVDAEIMLGQLRQESEVVITNDLDEADVVIVNTCGFIDAAKQESIDTILEIAERKGRGVERLIVTGCMVQKYRGELQQSIPEIDAFVGLDHLEKITQAVSGSVDDAAPVKRKMSVRLYEDLPRVLVTGTAHAYLKVSEGCSNPCTFCAIPQMRGKFRSRTIESLLREAQQLEAAGVKELALSPRTRRATAKTSASRTGSRGSSARCSMRQASSGSVSCTPTLAPSTGRCSS